MKVTFKLYASLGAFLPPEARKSNRMELDLPAGATVLQAILEQAVPPERCNLVLVNGHFIAVSERSQMELREGDVLAIWPPVAGG